MSKYPWHNGVFNPACTCGGSINRVNEDCERCMMHDWIYKQADENKRLRKARRELKRTLDKLAAADAISITWAPGILTLLEESEVGDE